MDSPNSVSNPDGNPERLDDQTEKEQREKFEDESTDKCKSRQRNVTDRYWSCFFVVVFISWIVTCRYVSIHPEANYKLLDNNFTDIKNTDFNVISDDVAITKNASQIVNSETDNKTDSCTEGMAKRKEKNIFRVLGLYFINFSYFDESSTEIDDPLIFVCVFFCIFYLSMSLGVVYDDIMLIKQPLIVAATLLFVSLLERLSVELFTDKSSIAFSLSNVSRGKLIYWVVPEVITLIILLSKTCPSVPIKFKKDNYPTCINYTYSVGVGIPVMVILKLLVAFTISLLQNVTWKNPLYYVIVGGSCYVGYTLYYVSLMTISCAVNRLSSRSKPSLKNLFHGFYIIVRYHFGTVCYNATPIIPRIHAKFVLKYSICLTLFPINGFNTTFSIAHNLARTVTAIDGTNYSKSLKRLLNFPMPEEECRFYNYGQIIRAIFGFLMSINCLMLILFWNIEANDPQFSNATWMMYLEIAFMFNLAISFFKATSDAVSFNDAFVEWCKEFLGVADDARRSHRPRSIGNSNSNFDSSFHIDRLFEEAASDSDGSYVLICEDLPARLQSSTDDEEEIHIHFQSSDGLRGLEPLNFV